MRQRASLMNSGPRPGVGSCGREHTTPLGPFKNERRWLQLNRKSAARQLVLAYICVVVGTVPAAGYAQSKPADISLHGLWSFDGRAACKSGPALVLAPDGTYEEAMLPNLRPTGHGRWSLRGSTIFATRPLPPSVAVPARSRMHPFKIVERSTNRVVTVSHHRVRRVMHYCGGSNPNRAP